jgi:hypothetical protein
MKSELIVLSSTNQANLLERNNSIPAAVPGENVIFGGNEIFAGNVSIEQIIARARGGILF